MENIIIFKILRGNSCINGLLSSIFHSYVNYWRVSRNGQLKILFWTLEDPIRRGQLLLRWALHRWCLARASKTRGSLGWLGCQYDWHVLWLKKTAGNVLPRINEKLQLQTSDPLILSIMKTYENMVAPQKGPTESIITSCFFLLGWGYAVLFLHNYTYFLSPHNLENRMTFLLIIDRTLLHFTCFSSSIINSYTVLFRDRHTQMLHASYVYQHLPTILRHVTTRMLLNIPWEMVTGDSRSSQGCQGRARRERTLPRRPRKSLCVVQCGHLGRNVIECSLVLPDLGFTMLNPKWYYIYI